MNDKKLVGVFLLRTANVANTDGVGSQAVQPHTKGIPAYIALPRRTCRDTCAYQRHILHLNEGVWHVGLFNYRQSLGRICSRYGITLFMSSILVSFVISQLQICLVFPNPISKLWTAHNRESERKCRAPNHT